MCITMCLYITITILLWLCSIYPSIKHYTIVILSKPYNLVIYSIFASPAKVSTVYGYLNTIQLGNMIIKRVHLAQCLGLILDESLNFKEHIENLTK